MSNKEKGNDRHFEAAPKANQDANSPLNSLRPNTSEWTEEEKVRFTEQNAALIRSVVNGFNDIRDAAIDKEDLLQEARAALWKSFDDYDPTRGALFTTYTRKCMVNAIRREFRLKNAVKRKPPGPVVPYEATVSEVGEAQLSGENQESQLLTAPSRALPVEKECLLRDVTSLVFRLLRDLFSEEERFVFLSLAQRHKTQTELAAELGCSQPKISMTYNHIRISLVYELQQAGYDDVLDEIFG